MSRYIDADALIRNIPSEEMIAKMAVASAPSIDVVRCKECKHNPKGIGWVSCPMTGANTRKPDDFCSYGERSEQVDDIG